MASVFTHPAVALGLLPWFREARSSKVVLLAGIILTIMPDIDILSFRFGIPYDHTFGHRGFTHSLFFAAVISVLCAGVISRGKNRNFLSIWAFLFLCAASHGIIDALTNGGYGIAFLSPFSNERYFFPFQPIEVSTLSIKRFFEGQGLEVISSELRWIWLPAAIAFLFGLYWWRRSNKKIT
jgi:inner membrane protein